MPFKQTNEDLLFYVYRHIRNDKNEPFYIGVGTKLVGKRQRHYNRAYSNYGRNPHWKNISKFGYEVEIIMEFSTKDIALEKEKEFIKLYGRRDLGTGTLCNMTDGGEEHYLLTEEARKKISEKLKGNKNGYREFKKIKPQKIYKTKEEIREAQRGTKPHSKRVYCSNGNSYESIGECIRLLFDCYDLTSSTKYRNYKNNISNVCNGKRLKYKSMKFSFSKIKEKEVCFAI